MLNGVLSSIHALFSRTTTPTAPTKPSVRCGASALSKSVRGYHETDDNVPPGTDDPLPSFGSYCIKASVDLVDTSYTEEDHIIYNITGYDDKLAIQEKVAMICSAYTTNDETLVCTNEKLVFLGPKENCNGNITILDVPNDQTFTF